MHQSKINNKDSRELKQRVTKPIVIPNNKEKIIEDAKRTRKENSKSL
jgi:hypothetical protein